MLKWETELQMFMRTSSGLFFSTYSTLFIYTSSNNSYIFVVVGSRHISGPVFYWSSNCSLMKYQYSVNDSLAVIMSMSIRIRLEEHARTVTPWCWIHCGPGKWNDDIAAIISPPRHDHLHQDFMTKIHARDVGWWYSRGVVRVLSELKHPAEFPMRLTI